MKQFFKFMFASMLGFILAGILLFFIMLFIISGVVSSAGDKEVTVKSNSVLEIDFKNPITERTSKNPFDFDFSFSPKQELGLNDIIKNIAKAKDDDRVNGIFLNLSTLQAGIATTEEIRNALIDFKQSKKFIYVYGEYFTQATYYLASVADKIYLNPQGGFDFRGLRSQVMFFKGTLEKLEIEPEIIRHGKFKSAVEPFMYDKMSPESRLQIATLLNAIWDHYISNVASSRKITENDLKSIASELKIKFPEDALKYKLVDKLAYYDEVEKDLKQLLGEKEKDKIKFIALKKYDKASVSSKGVLNKKKIAVIYATGEIGMGDGDENTITSDRIGGAISKAAKDTSIKAIVLRVNSPGGFVLPSDIIWHEVTLAKKLKPVVVSMGDVAASGGYYISCAADTIVAEPNTITGSIGVFGILMNTQKLFKNKLGITFDTVKTGKYSDLFSLTRPLTDEEKNILQQEIERVYDTFITRVSDGRHIDKAMVDSLGQGRVWSGTDAKRLGLVDVVGGINTAIEIAAKMAKVEKYRTISMPEQEDFFKKLVKDFSDEMETKYVTKNLGDAYKYYEQAQVALKQNGMMARMMENIEIH